MAIAAINLVSVLVAALVAMFLGALWYGPLFGKKWMAEMGITPKSMKSMKITPTTAYIVGFLVVFIMAFVLSLFIQLLGATTWVAGARIGLWVWLGFVATTLFDSILWENKSVDLFVLNSGYRLVSLLLMGSILAAW